MKLPTFKATAELGPTGGADHRPCAACGEYCIPDEATKLCRPCWRVVVLTPPVTADPRPA